MNEITLNLLLWQNGLEECEEYINTLKNLGFAVRDSRVTSHHELENTLPIKKWNIVIIDEASTDISLIEIQRLIASQTTNTITVFIRSIDSHTPVYDLCNSGANIIVEHNQSALLLIQLPRAIHFQSLEQQLELAQEKITEEEQRNRTLMDASRDAIAYIQDGMHAYSNQSYLELFGITEQDELDCMPLLDLIAKESRDEVKSILQKFNRNELTVTTLDCDALKKDQHLNVNINFTEALLDGEPSIQVIIQDQSYSEELNLKIEELSSKDLVTNLNNRHHFIEKLKDFLASKDRVEADPHSIIFIKIDNFNELQQILGIAGYDIFLRDVTKIITPLLEGSSNLARFSDDTFTSLHPTNINIDLHTICKTITQSLVSSNLIIDGEQVATTASIGISPIKTQQVSAEKILVEVERACNIAHQAGGNTVQELQSLETTDNAEKGNNDSSSTSIKDALKNNQFRLVFQPIVSLHASPGKRYQVLLRMLNDEGEEVSPNDFLPIAESAGLMHMIDRWVIVNSINTLIKQRKSGNKLQLFIKLSEDSLLEPETIKWISKYLHDSRIPGDCLVFELNQEYVVEHKKETEAFIKMVGELHCLTAIGHVIGLDETIDYLAHLDTNFLKIDGSLISNIASDKSAQDIAKKIASLAQKNGKQTIAEFVHDANTLAVLWQHGINFVQGYYLQQPDHEMSYNFDD